MTSFWTPLAWVAALLKIDPISSMEMPAADALFAIDLR